MVFWNSISVRSHPLCHHVICWTLKNREVYTSNDHNLYTGVGSFCKPGAQHDAQEFLVYLMNFLKETISPR